jgi:hypothetical protein
VRTSSWRRLYIILFADNRDCPILVRPRASGGGLDWPLDPLTVFGLLHPYYSSAPVPANLLRKTAGASTTILAEWLAGPSDNQIQISFSASNYDLNVGNGGMPFFFKSSFAGLITISTPASSPYALETNSNFLLTGDQDESTMRRTLAVATSPR